MYSKITVYLWENVERKKKEKMIQNFIYDKIFFIVSMVCDENIVLDSNQRDVWKNIYIFQVF